MGIAAQVFQAVEALEYTFVFAKGREHEHPALYAGMEREQQLIVVASLAFGSPEVLKETTLCWIAPDMVDLLQHAARTLPAYDFAPSVLPWPQGLCVAAKPLMSGQFPPRPPFAVTSIGWLSFDSGALVLPLSSHWGNQFLSPVLAARLQTGLSWPERTDELGVEAAPLVETSSRLCCTLWLLLQQKVAVRRQIGADRATGRRWSRDHDQPVPEITIVELRRPIQTVPHEDSEVGFVDWSHRWIVDGHWRNQYHPSTGGHIPTWIAPHIKGPEDKPLVVKRKINAWVR